MSAVFRAEISAVSAGFCSRTVLMIFSASADEVFISFSASIALSSLDLGSGFAKLGYKVPDNFQQVYKDAITQLFDTLKR